MGKLKSGAWPWGDPDSPVFPEDSYDVAKSALFQDPARPLPGEDVSFKLLELHVIQTDKDDRPEDTAQDPGTEPLQHETVHACRVFTHVGLLSEMQDEDSGTKECYYAPSTDEALRIYDKTYSSFAKFNHKTKKFLSRWIGSPVYRKQSLEKGITDGPAISDEVTRLVEYLWREAMGKLREILSVPYRKIGIGKVEKAEGILLQVRKLIDQDELDSDSVDRLSKEFYKLIPHRPYHVQQLSTKRVLASKQELCQLIHDIVTVSEATDWSQRSSSQSRYRALQCYMESLAPDHPEYIKVESLVMETVASEDPLEIKRIFAASRAVEEAVFARDIGNNKLLFHASRPANFLGILSRGVLLPKIVVEVFGGSRRDAGMLGSGIYFGDRVSTAQQYSSPSQQTGTRLMVVNQVALGNSLDLYKFDLTLDEAPEGYHSTHGVSRTDTRQSEFKDDEYVVYEASQQCIRYLVEFTLSDDTEIDMPLCETPMIQEGVEETIIFCQEAQQESSALPPSDIDLSDIELVGDPVAGIEAGLVSDNERSDTVTLQAVHIRAKILDLVGQVVVLQSYRNNSDESMEAKYVFPIDEAAAVCGFEAFINDKHVVGVVKEKQEAHQEYRKAVEEGHGAYLMDEESPNVFSVSVGNLPARCDVLIKITYVTELTVEGDKLAFSLLGTVAPWKRQEVLAKGTPGGGEAVDVELETVYREESVQVAVAMASKITCIESPTHSILVKQTDKEASVTFRKDAQLEDGFQLLIGLEEMHKPRMWIEEQPGLVEKAVMLVFYPEFDVQTLKSPEIVLMLDSSNSMKGQVLDEAKKLLVLILNHLPARCTFNVIFFGTEYDELFPTSQPKTKANLKKARDFIVDATAEQGCTDFWRPLQSNHLLRSKSAIRNLFLITDGHLSNEEATLKAVKRHRDTSRMFTFGVSKTANRHLLAAVARSGGGAFEFFDSKAKSTWEKKIKLQVSRASQPAVTSLAVHWDQPGSGNRGPPLQAPVEITSVFRRNRLLVYGLVDDCRKVTLSFEINGKRLETTLVSADHHPTTGKVLHQLAARAVIRNWEEGVLHADRTEHESQKSELKSRIVEMSIQYSVVTPFTSFIAVETRDEEEQRQLAEGQSPVTGPSVSELLEAEDVDRLPALQWKDPTASSYQLGSYLSPLDRLSTLLQTAQAAEESYAFKSAEKYYEEAYDLAKEKLSFAKPLSLQVAQSFSRFYVRVKHNVERAYELVSNAFQDTKEAIAEQPEETVLTEDTSELEELDALQQAVEWAETCQMELTKQATQPSPQHGVSLAPRPRASLGERDGEEAAAGPESSGEDEFLEATEWTSAAMEGDSDVLEAALMPEPELLEESSCALAPVRLEQVETQVRSHKMAETVIEAVAYDPQPLYCSEEYELAPLPESLDFRTPITVKREYHMSLDGMAAPSQELKAVAEKKSDYLDISLGAEASPPPTPPLGDAAPPPTHPLGDAAPPPPHPLGDAAPPPPHPLGDAAPPPPPPGPSGATTWNYFADAMGAISQRFKAVTKKKKQKKSLDLDSMLLPGAAGAPPPPPAPLPALGDMMPHYLALDEGVDEDESESEDEARGLVTDSMGSSLDSPTLDIKGMLRRQSASGAWDFHPECDEILGIRIDVAACENLIREKLQAEMSREGTVADFGDTWTLILTLVATLVYCRQLRAALEDLQPNTADSASEALLRAREYAEDQGQRLDKTLGLRVDWDDLASQVIQECLLR